MFWLFPKKEMLRVFVAVSAPLESCVRRSSRGKELGRAVGVGWVAADAVGQLPMEKTFILPEDKSKERYDGW